MGNLLGGFVMLALCVRLARPHDPLPGAGAHAWAIAATLLLVLQVGLGGLASASYAGLSCSGLGGCPFAEVVRTADWASLNPWREPVLHPVPPINPGGALVHTLHRATALGLALLLAPIGVIALRRGRRRAGAAILLLLAAQWSIGLAMSVLALPLGLALAHNMLAALLLATLLTLV
jgi:cytochrome c oxidase assembly protein subunit 15